MSDESSVYKEAIWQIDVEQSIAGLREAADKLSEAGVPAQAEIKAENAGRWLHIEARFMYFSDDEDGADAPVPESDKVAQDV
ncbi:hypothetical protein LCGC14_0587650 [marine sediment metagenome]|uniref:Uncharacterized protein n=1 Tax=marine sediment metagenome TaxID=412755 RepID=A0A0F9RY80_9ZZZZ